MPQDMVTVQSKTIFQINKYYAEKVQVRMGNIALVLREICKIVQEVLREVEVQEPRFISSLVECNGR